MNVRDQLRQAIDAQQGRLAAGIPPDREAALLALVGQIDRTRSKDPVSLAGPCLGAPTALWWCLTGGNAGETDVDPLQWASAIIAECRELEAAKLVLRFADEGAMRLAVDPPGAFDARLAGDRVPSLWLERADIAVWAGNLAKGPDTTSHSDIDGGDLVAQSTHQLPYPPAGAIGDVPVSACREVIAALVNHVRSSSGGDTNTLVFDEPALIGTIAASAALPPDQIGQVLSALTLDAGNAGWHAGLPGGPMAPLVRVGANRLALCRLALRTESLFFLSRELRRRDPERYHNAAYQREDALRADLYARFAERRFVTSPGRIVLRRDDRRNRTDLDAAILDRKTGTLALFELKSQDPFARTVDELERQRDNVARAGRQVAAILDWINRHGADEVLSRMDRATAKRFRVHRVLPFVLSRYLAGMAGGGQPGGVAWGSWGQVLRLLDSIERANPLLALHERLHGDRRSIDIALPARVRLGELSITVRGGWEL